LKGGQAISQLATGQGKVGAPELPTIAMLSTLLAGDDVVDVAKAADTLGEDRHAVILADKVLQDIADYRGALRAWFAALRNGGHLILIVPHAFLATRQLALPVRDRPTQRRLYTPASLLVEVEEALPPNSYRVRLLSDDDRDYDYSREGGFSPVGHGDVVLVLQKIEPPAWTLEESPTSADKSGPDYGFAPSRTRIERAEIRNRQRILILKLDHLGDFVMGLPALHRARALFRDAHLTLVVGSWNLDMARSMDLADEIIPFDAFPRNSAEEEPDVVGKRALFDRLLPDRYDLAIDLRTDTDTRTLLGRVNAPLKAGLGKKSDFPFLDISLALEIDRVEREAAREYRLDHHAFSSQDAVHRLDHRALYAADDLDRGRAIIWGPYWRLRAGHYLFEPFLEMAPSPEGLLMLDVAINFDRKVRRVIIPGDATRLEFDVPQDDSVFEFRIWGVDEAPPLPFSFYGGKLIRQGMPGLLHQSDYLELLIDLIARRLDRVGLLTDVAQT
jgi:hypothetical protein